MKRLLTLLLAGVLAAGALSACGSVSKKETNTAPTDAPLPTYAASSKSAGADSAEDDPEAVSSNASDEERKGEDSIGTLSDYVKNARETVIVQGGGTEKRCRIPKILLDSSDAKAANSEITAKYGEIFDAPDRHSYIISLDYEAYLYDKFLSVYINCRVDGGNSDGLCFCFDVTTGKVLGSETLCSMLGRDYNTVLGKLKDNLTSYYDKKFSMLQDNDEMRSQTLADSNVDSTKMFLNESHQLMAMVNIYAAVGGGQWVETISAE